MIDEAHKHVRTTIDTVILLRVFWKAKHCLANSKEIKKFYTAYSQIVMNFPQVGGKFETPHSVQFLPQVGEKEQDIAEMLFSIPWTHHKFILDKIKGDVQKGLFFVAKAKEVYFWRATFLCWFGVLQPPAAMLCTHWPKDGQIDTSRFGANADVRELLWQAYVYAAAYQLYLPDKALLQAKVKEWIQEFEENEEIKKLEED